MATGLLAINHELFSSKLFDEPFFRQSAQSTKCHFDEVTIRRNGSLSDVSFDEVSHFVSKIELYRFANAIIDKASLIEWPLSSRV